MPRYNNGVMPLVSRSALSQVQAPDPSDEGVQGRAEGRPWLLPQNVRVLELDAPHCFIIRRVYHIILSCNHLDLIRSRSLDARPQCPQMPQVQPGAAAPGLPQVPHPQMHLHGRRRLVILESCANGHRHLGLSMASANSPQACNPAAAAIVCLYTGLLTPPCCQLHLLHEQVISAGWHCCWPAHLENA